MKVKRIRRYVAAALLLIFIVLPAFTVYFVPPAVHFIRDAYNGLQFAQSVEPRLRDPFREMGTGELLVDFMKANNQRWPSDWAELEAFYERSTKSYSAIENFSDIRNYIEIDFSFDPASLSFWENADKHGELDPSFRVVWQRNRTSSEKSGAVANNLVYWHLWEAANWPDGKSTRSIGKSSAIVDDNELPGPGDP